MTAMCFLPSMPVTAPRISTVIRHSQSQPATRIGFTRIRASTTQEANTVDYSSPTSVFPAEACETVGGDACAGEAFPEVKLKPEAKKTAVAQEDVDREYLEYNEPKTVFPGEACDDLGGEFCEPEYQTGVFKDGVSSK